jgi:hypothetical protein
MLKRFNSPKFSFEDVETTTAIQTSISDDPSKEQYYNDNNYWKAPVNLNDDILNEIL